MYRIYVIMYIDRSCILAPWTPDLEGVSSNRLSKRRTIRPANKNECVLQFAPNLSSALRESESSISNEYWTPWMQSPLTKTYQRWCFHTNSSSCTVYPKVKKANLDSNTVMPPRSRLLNRKAKNRSKQVLEEWMLSTSQEVLDTTRHIFGTRFHACSW